MTATQNGNDSAPHGADPNVESETSGTSSSERSVQRLNRRLREAFHELYDSFVDPMDALYDSDGSRWLTLGPERSQGDALPCATELELREIRRQCRRLAITNEFAINGHENRISYIVGSGHTYRATIKKGSPENESLCAAVQEVLDEFIRLNHWQTRQQEIVRRLDRDGEVFLRYFPNREGQTRVRFIEPGQVSTPSERLEDPACSFGIETDPKDVEEVKAYYLDGTRVDALQIQHRRANVDLNVKRGLPLFYPVRKNLMRAEKLLRNMSTVAEIQSAIALIRKHHAATRTAVQQFIGEQADLNVNRPPGTRPMSIHRYGPGTILDAAGDIEYDFPASQLNAGSYVAVLQADLRAVASRLVMPEFMLTSDASNANYSSTMVAEGPAVKMFERLQAEHMADNLEVMNRVIEHAIDAGRLPAAAATDVTIEASPPQLAVRDRLEDDRISLMQFKAGILSPQTWSRMRGLDYDQEQANIRAAKPKEEPKEAPKPANAAPSTASAAPGMPAAPDMNMPMEGG